MSLDFAQQHEFGKMLYIQGNFKKLISKVHIDSR